MTDGMVGLLSIPLHILQRNNRVPQRSDTFLSHRYACYNVYETADGKYISIGAVENRFWKNLCDALQVPEYVPLQYDDNRREEILDFFQKAFKKKTLEEWVKELRDKDVCWGRIQNLEEVLNDPLFVARDMVREVKDAKGKPVTMLGIPVKLSETPGSIRSAAVGFGGSTRRMLAELGYTKGQIEELIEKGVV